jgi:hypothetical protein
VNKKKLSEVLHLTLQKLPGVFRIPFRAGTAGMTGRHPAPSGPDVAHWMKRNHFAVETALKILCKSMFITGRKKTP